MTSNKASTLLKRGKDILRQEGLRALIKRGFLWSSSSFFTYRNYYMYEEKMSDAAEIEFTPKIENYLLKVISTPEQVCELIAEGFDFGSYIDDINKVLRKGVIVFCAFVERELAHITYVALTEEAKNGYGERPFVVDFLHNEVCSGGSETDPKYRRKGIHVYAYSRIFQFLKEKGYLIDRFVIARDNIASRNAMAKFGPRIYAEGRYLKLLWWESWKDKPIEKIIQ